MSSALLTSLLFATHLLALVVALGAALAVSRDGATGRFSRITATLGFLALSAGYAIHGASFGGDLSTVTVFVRTAGYALVLVAALPPRTAGVAAAAVLPARVLAPAGAALAAALATAWRRRGDRPGLALAAGLALLATSEVLFGLSGRIDWAMGAGHGVMAAGCLAIAWYVVAATRQSIRFRLATAFVALLLVVVLGASSVVANVIAHNLRDQTFARLTDEGRGAAQQFRTITRDQAFGLRSVAIGVSQGIKRGLSISKRGLRSTHDLFVPDADFLVVFDRNGLVLGRYGLGPGAAVTVAGSGLVGQAIRHATPTASIDGVGEADLAFMTAQPVHAGRRVVGGAVAGFRVDTALVRQTLLGRRVAVFRGLAPDAVAETGFGQGVTPALDPSLLRDANERFVAGTGVVTETMDVGGREHFAALLPLQRSDGRVVGTLVVAEPVSILVATQRDANRLLFLITLGVIGLSFLLALLASRRITRPVVSLTEAARSVQAGDLEATARAEGEDEVASLATAFNQMTGSIRKMTGDLREAAQEEAALRNRLETVLDSMGDGLVAVNEEGAIVTYNPAAALILGESRNRVLGRQLDAVIRGRDAEGNPVAPLSNGQPGVIFVRRRGGKDVPVSISSAPLRGGRGRNVGRVYVLRDMTREREIERMKTEFLANVSHELRTPLTPIIGYSEMLSRRQVPAPRAREFAGGILDSAKRLERIVGMLVDFSAIEGGRMKVVAEPVDLESRVRKAVEDWKGQSKKHRFEVRAPSRLPAVLADVSLLDRVLDELLDNAVKYSPKGGRITVSLGAEDTGSGRLVAVEVTDPGIGLEPEQLQHIFDDFRQVDASDTRMFGGLGLGLAFVKRIVEAHRGRIGATSEPGSGTTFRVTLPVADAAGRRKRR